jgi:DNA-binding SARP family transcriptional activator/predicted ATPase
MARLAIRLLGALQVTLDGAPLTGFESDKERALLAYLAEESQQPHRREKLAGLLWPEHDERAARNNLRRVLSNLRRLLGDRAQVGPPCLLVTRQTLRFNPDNDAWVDSQTFARLLDPPGAQLEEAIHLYRGDFLEGFSIADSPACEEWIVLCRERYQRLMMKTLHRLVEEYERLGRYEHALELAWKQVDLEPWWEEAQRQLIRLLALSGRRSEALVQYAHCRRLLAKELDVPPSAETTRLYEQIRDETLTGSLPAAGHRSSPTHNLPLTPGPFVGREAEIAAIQERLRDPACRLLTLVGGGGMGKTRLALEAVADWLPRLREDELEGATLVSLAPLRAAEALIPAIAQAIDQPLSPGDGPGRQLLNALARKRQLLILDSFEHLLEGAGFVAQILRTAPQVKVLVTSRARLNLHDEHCLPVAGIPFPEEIPADGRQARGFAAVNLFLQAARRLRPGFEPAEADWTAIAHICRLVEGMPLGILLAAAWSGVLRPDEIVAEMSHGLDFLEADWPDAPRRQRSIRAVFDRSWKLLPERERKVFQALSVFSGGFERAAAQEVSGASLHELRTLADKSLLQHTPSGRYEIHELLRQYVAEKLHVSPGAAAEAADRHCAYFMAALQGWEADLTGDRQPAALVEMEAESGNISAAWAWAVEHEQVERLDQAMDGLEHFYWHSGRYREAEAALGAAASIAAQAACPRVQARAWAWQSNFQRAIGRQDAALELQEQCLALLQDPALAGTDTRLERAVLAWSRGVTVCMADYAQGRRLFEESFSLFRELDYQWGMAWSLNTWGTMSMFLGDYKDAQRRLEKGFALYQALGSQSGVAGVLPRLAEIAWRQGRFDEAEGLAREGVAIALEANTRTESAFALLNLGEVLEKVAKFSEARSVLQQSLERYIDLGHRHYITQAHGFLGSVELHRGRYQEARVQAQICLDLAQAHGPHFCVGLGHLLLSCLDLAQGVPDTARGSLQEAVAVYQEAGSKDDLGVALVCLALSARKGGDRLKARQHLGQALEIAQEFGAVLPQLWALPVAALLLADKGESERAAELYTLASGYPFMSKSCWFKDVVGREISNIAATLPLDALAAIEERGRSQDLEATAVGLLAEIKR